MNLKNSLKSSLFTLVLLVVVTSCNDEAKVSADSFTVNGTIKGLDTEYMSRSIRDSSGKRYSDTIFVENGKFSYTAKIDKATHIVFWPNVERTIKRTERGYYPAKSSQFAFIAKPGDNIVFNGEVTDFIDAYPTGTKANDDLAKINSKIFPLMNASVNYLLVQNKLKKEDIRFKTVSDSISQLDQEVIQLKKEFVLNNSTSEAAVWYLSDMMIRKHISNEEAIKAFNAFDKKLKNYTYYQEVASRVKGIEATLIGKTAPDFTTNKTVNGKEFTFSSLRGKYVLIDFWGVWCGPCVEEMPTVKEYSKKYADKLTVLGINSGDTKEKMVAFLKKNDYNWQQVISGNDTDNLVLKFNVAGFPTKFIIDPNGKIIDRYLGSGEKAFLKLDELLK
ncbi:MAG: TlpA disulfide reductase family protein [Polaribacter sp.]|mgnify:CR=1 FL=1|nr:TlpA disulfide reductase family protein [Polaribacter sp.]MDG1811493.1 TlpA disulfide reductase family protein [Polaribacter sp.]MDG1994068.1 TlpA disulfide reductase family protein [Polaribacter sp.]